MDSTLLNRNFSYHSPKGDQPKKYQTLRCEFLGIANLVNNMCPDSREKSIALTKLEESVMWANASIARNE